MIWFLLRNYFTLRTFMNIKINPFGNLKWEVDYKISHDELNDKQKKLSDKFIERLRVLDFGK
jgi:hypothetical protein